MQENGAFCNWSHDAAAGSVHSSVLNGWSTCPERPQFFCSYARGRQRSSTGIRALPSRRGVGALLFAAGLATITCPAVASPPPPRLLSGAEAEEALLAQIEPILLQASQAWGDGLDPSNPDRKASLNLACKLFDTIVALDPNHVEWLEARGQVRIDAKQFKEAVSDFSNAISRRPDKFKAYSGRALAYEGLAEWENAVRDYTNALEKAKLSTGTWDSYIMNSRGNALASLGHYADALNDYLLSTQGFQKAKELDGAIYAAGNAALMRIQLGDDTKGMKELMGVARRAPASIDMRAALAALYWSQGQEQAAEEEWHFACDNINAGQVFDGCSLYKDSDWLGHIRRWPPIMVERMENFLKLRSR